MSNWIKTLAEEAKKENWCVKSWCTTCGCEVFRSNLIKKCFKNNNVPFPSKIKSSKRQNPIIVDLFQDDIEFCVKTISEELATLNNEDINQIDPVLLRKIFQEIYAKIYIKLMCWGLASEFLFCFREIFPFICASKVSLTLC